MIRSRPRRSSPVWLPTLLAGWAGCQGLSWSPWSGPGSSPPAPPVPASEPAQQAALTAAAATPADVESQRGPRPQGPWVGPGALLVNGEEITVEEVLDPIRAHLERAAATLSYTPYRDEVQRVVGQQIWQLVNEVLVYRDARKTLNERVDQALDKEVERLIQARIDREFDGLQARFESHLAELGWSMDRVRELVRRQVLVSEFLRQRLKEAVPEPSRQELYAYYQQHLAEYRRPASAELFLIEIPVADLVDESQAAGEASAHLQARRQALEVARRARQEIDSGVAFAAVARSYSKGLKAPDGGAWGVITAPGLRGRYAEASRRLFQMKAGECSEVIDAGESFFIVRAGLVTPEHTVPFEEAQPEIRDTLRAARVREMETEYLARLREKADIQRWEEFKKEVVARIPRPATEEQVPGASGRP